MLHQLGYVSTQAFNMSVADLDQILIEARKRNTDQDITGLLLYREDSFFQVLEGSREAVDDIFKLIQTDGRHKKIEVLFDDPISEREFSDWAMAFKKLEDGVLKSISENDDRLSIDANPRELFHELSRTKKLVSLFRNMG